ncbi:MAG: Gfo/Idh/MocA family oxidoreductase [Anaerohalosphaeraceae bacterium]|nr:Gfo/Idh/MocA family oxidoreductase [Anaerohalosphaeraceae bacterium]
MSVVKLIVIGAGSRGTGYAGYTALHPEQAQVVGVAEPREFYRNKMVSDYNIPPENVFMDWKELAEREKFADAVIIATQDTMHVEPAVAFAKKGYHILLEKPMATNEQDCCRIAEAAAENKIILSVCHVLRYTPYTMKLKEIIDSGIIGDVVNIQHLEPVGYWHQAHSFVRGNWRKESESTPMLLQKACHDIDWLRYIMDTPCVKVSSFGNLKHFRKENKPQGAGSRCMDCSCEAQCPYSAKKIYIGNRAEKDDFGWPNNVLTSDLTVQGVTEAVRDGPYGRCVYECDNDVVDHQVVNMLFEDGKTASFTMTAFTEHLSRKTHIFGTHGSLYGDGKKIEHFDFLTDKHEVIDTQLSDGSIAAGIKGGHGGGDYGIMKNFIASVVGDNGSNCISSGPQESLEAHLMVFAAEKARRNGIVVEL